MKIRYKPERTANVVKVAMAAVLAAVGLTLVSPLTTTAEEFVLHPGYIHGTVTLPDPQEPNGAHVIGKIQVSASGTDANGNYYSAGVTVSDLTSTVGEFDLVVEGGVNYTLRIIVYYGPSYVKGSQLYYRRQITFYKSAAVGIGATIQVACTANAWIDISASVQGESISGVWVSASWERYPSAIEKIYSTVDAFAPQVRIPVEGRTSADFEVTCHAYLPDGDGIDFPDRTGLVVYAGQVVPVNFDMTPGYLEGTVTLIGGQLYSGSATAYNMNPETGQIVSGVGAGYVTVTSPGDGAYRIPCFPGTVRSYHVFSTTKGNYTLLRTNDIVANATTTCNVELNLDASVAVTVNIPNIGNFFGYVAVGSQIQNISGPATTRYVFDSLAAGRNIFNSIIEGVYTLHPSLVAATRKYQYPIETIQLELGQHIELDKSFTAGFLRGTVLSPNCSVLSELQSLYVSGFDLNRPADGSSMRGAQTSVGRQSTSIDGAVVNDFELFMEPGEQWTVVSAQAGFQHLLADGSYCSPHIAITESQGSMAVYNLPQVRVAAGETVSSYNIGYKLGQITARLRVADGSSFSQPLVTGSYYADLTGPASRYVSLSDGLNVSDVTEASILLYAIPGVYKLTAKATVGGSSTQFGAPFFVTVDAGDVIEKDPDGPDVTISFPPGEYLACGDSVEVTGTVIDASGVASFSINGQTVALDAQGNFTFPAVNLVVGNNTLHFEAVDLNGKSTTVDRTVIRDGIPVAQDDAYTLFDDEVLSLAAPGVLANDTDGDNDELTVTGGTAPSSGSLTLTANGALTYMPVRGVGGSYAFTYAIGDGKCGGNTATVNIEVKLRNQAPVIAATTASVNEDTKLTLTLATDPDSDTLTVTVTGGPDHGTASFNGGVVSYMPGADYNGTDTLAFTVSDGRGGVASGTLVITVLPVNDSPVLTPLSLSAAAIAENGSVTLNASFTDPDAGDAYTVTILWNDGSSSSLELGAGELTFSASHQFLDDDPTGTPADAYAICVSVSDAGGLTDTGSAKVTVNNAAPILGSLTAPIAPVPVSQAPAVTVEFSDVGTLDTHSVTFAWGDDTSTAQAASGGSASATHTYALPGVYTVTVTITDDDTGAVSQSTAYVVVYDPTGSFVTGGGWIVSPAGAYTPDPTLTGRAHFGFVSRYEKGATVPSGKTDFRFVTASLDFHSTAYDWLVVAGMKAMFKGVGTINGAGDYGFMVTASDGDVDQFRIQIWDRATEVNVYDNQLGADEMADATDAIEGGAIEVHQVK